MSPTAIFTWLFCQGDWFQAEQGERRTLNTALSGSLLISHISAPSFFIPWLMEKGGEKEVVWSGRLLPLSLAGKAL